MEPRFQPELFEPLPHDETEAKEVAILASVAFGLMLMDFLWLIRDEAKYVWSRLRASWTARIYVFARYIGIATQIYNVYFAARMYLGKETSPHGCRIWFTYQAVVVQFLLLFVEGLFMHRTYALFLRNQIILIVLISFALGQIVSMGLSARLSFPSNQHTVTCMMVKSNPGNAFFGATTMTTNVMICFMTFWRFFHLPVTWTRQRLARVIMRDLALSLISITVIMLFLTLCSLGVIKPPLSGNITYYLLVCVIWIAIGRIIVNHERLPRDSEEGDQGESSTWQGTLQLTSQIEMGQSELALDTQSQSTDLHTETSGTLQASLSAPVTKANRLSPPSACESDSSRRWLSDHAPSNRHEHRCSPQPSSAELSMEISIRHLSLPNVCASEGDPARPEDSPRSDAEDHSSSGHPSSEPNPQSPSSETPPADTSESS